MKKMRAYAWLRLTLYSLHFIYIDAFLGEAKIDQTEHFYILLTVHPNIMIVFFLPT